MISTFIIVLFLLVLPRNALFYEGFREFCCCLYFCSEMCDCGKSEQNHASCYYLLVVEIVVKGKGLLLRIFLL